MEGRRNAGRRRAPPPPPPPDRARTHSQDPAARLAAHLDHLRGEAAARPDSFEAAFQLALLLQQLDHSAPDGGTRVPEALAQYERAEALAPTARLRAEVASNVGALLLAGGRLEEAAEAMRRTLRLLADAELEGSATVRGDGEAEGSRLPGLRAAESARLGCAALERPPRLATDRRSPPAHPLSCPPSPPPPTHTPATFRPQRAGTLFNLAKVQEQLGRAGEAQALLEEAAGVARGVAPATFAKALAGMQHHPPELVADMRECARYLQRTRLGGCRGGGGVGRWGGGSMHCRSARPPASPCPLAPRLPPSTPPPPPSTPPTPRRGGRGRALPPAPAQVARAALAVGVAGLCP